ncbi:hypothetical protein [Streptomyces canus]|uniref:hypothetical protein n=1 Tax=Streptomyces canus TaxID=58343 RepID=UPI002DD7EB85|nr:hypothetical protein [Streptomyces canus]WSD87567.1 hypothetical protein OG925_26190 [Streptomyces canus]
MTDSDVGGTRRKPRHVEDLTDVYDFLEEVRLRPGMWVNRSSLQHLDSMLTGYRVALGIHDIAEPFDFWTPGSQGRFAEWLWQRLGRHSPLGWAVEIEREAERSGRPAMEMFFELLDEFRAADHQGQDGAKPDGHPPAETQQAHVSD